MTNWLQHYGKWSNCQLCALAQQRSQVCIARSDWPDGASQPNLRLPCDVLFVGEAPGMSEDAIGIPFVGPAGELLDRIIEQSLPEGVTYSMTNLVACFPRQAKERGENEPERGEVFECRPRLIEFVNMAQPQLIVRVGKMAVQYLGFDLRVPVVDIDHPAHILRMPQAQKGMAVQRCIVHLRCTCEDVLQSPKPKWKEWGHGEDKIRKELREQLRQIYGDAESDIPF